MTRGEKALPGWVEEANRRLRSNPRSEIEAGLSLPPVVGEFRLAEPLIRDDQGPRLVYVFGVDHASGSAQVALISNETAMAAEGDFVLNGTDVGLPFDLLVEPEMECELRWIQIGRRVTSTGKGWLPSGRSQSGTCDGERSSRAQGVHAVAESERERFKANEMADLARLVGPTRDGVAVGEDGIAVVVDPELLVRRAGEPEASYLHRVLAAAGEVSMHPRVIVPSGSLDESMAACRDDRAFGMDLENAIRPLLERSLTRPPRTSTETVVYQPARRVTGHPTEVSLSDELNRLADLGHTSARLVTDLEAWDDRLTEPAVPVAVNCFERGRIQLIRQTLEVFP